MIVIEHQRIELDYCTKCQGVWFDAGEMEMLLSTADISGDAVSPEKLLGADDAAPSHQGRKCPVCRRRMKEVVVGEPPVNIDFCTSGDGLWFDGGEVGHLLKQLAEKQNVPSPVLSFLGDTFKMKE